MVKAVVESASDWTKRTGNAVKQTAGSVVAGIGEMTGQSPMARPDIADYTSENAFREFKEYNTKTNLRVNEKRMWGSVAERVVGSLLTGVTIGIGAGIMAALSSAGPWAVALGSLGAIGAVVGVSIAVFYAIGQPATRDQSDKFMDVDDYKLKRLSGLIAQEVKKPSPNIESAVKTEESAIYQDNKRADGKQWTDVLAEQDPQSMHRA